MAKQLNKDSKGKSQAGFFGKAKGVFAGLGKRIAGSFHDMFAELKKVTWPSKQGLINYTAVVLAFMAIMAVLIYVLDAGAGILMNLISRV